MRNVCMMYQHIYICMCLYICVWRYIWDIYPCLYTYILILLCIYIYIYAIIYIYIYINAILYRPWLKCGNPYLYLISSSSVNHIRSKYLPLPVFYFFPYGKPYSRLTLTLTLTLILTLTLTLTLAITLTLTLMKNGYGKILRADMVSPTERN